MTVIALLHSACRTLNSLLFPTNSAHNLPLVRVIGIRVIQNTQFMGMTVVYDPGGNS